MDVAAIDGHQPTAVRLVSRAAAFDDGGPPRSASGTRCDEGHRHDDAASVSGLRVGHSPHRCNAQSQGTDVDTGVYKGGPCVYFSNRREYSLRHG